MADKGVQKDDIHIHPWFVPLMVQIMVCGFTMCQRTVLIITQ